MEKQVIDGMEELKNVVDTVNEELKESLSESGVIDFVEILIGCIAHNTVSWTKLINILKNHSISVTQKIPIYKLGKYLSGIQKVEDDLGKSCELSNKLFGNEKTRKDNGFRLYKYVTEAETDKKIELLVDATRVFLMDCIDLPTLFRIYKAIVETLPEDLNYLSELTERRLKENIEMFQGNTEILALSRTGMMIVAGEDGNKGVEEQDYTISSLGYMVDRYALSIDNDEKQKLYKEIISLGDVKYKPNISTIPLEEIDGMF